MLWGKQHGRNDVTDVRYKTKMMTGLTAIGEQENNIILKLGELRESSELKRFFLALKSDLEEIGIDHVCYRVKTNNSAVRKYRVGNYVKSDELDDLCGMMIVTENLEDINQIVEMITPLLENPDEQDLTNTFESRGVPPLSYIINSNMHFDDLDNSVPIEIRIQEKKRFLVIESLYYTLYKNDEIDTTTKWDLNDILMRIMMKQSNINDEKLDPSIKGALERDLKHLVDENAEFLNQNKDLVYEAWREYARVRFEYNYAREIEAGSEWVGDILNRVNDMLIDVFDQYYASSSEYDEKESSFPSGARIEHVLKQMESLTYKEVVELIKQKEHEKTEMEAQER